MLGQNIDIMAPQWLDVVFKDRNQAYGAYELRRNNPRNTNRALMIAVGAFVFVLSLPTIINKIEGYIPKKDIKGIIVENTPLLPPPTLEKPKALPPVIEQQRQVRSQHNVVVFPPPVVRDVVTNQDPPTTEELQIADPGQQKLTGDPGAGVNIDDPVGPKDIKGVTESKVDNSNELFVAVEVQPMFPGGEAAFNKFLSSHIRYPNVAKETGIQGHVYIQFVVERDGSLTDMKIIRDPGSGLGDEALRVLKSSPHWTPGVQNGKPVRVMFTVPVNFSLAE